MRPFQAVFSRTAMEFVIGAGDAEMAEVERWINRIERAPHSRGDFVERDADGRTLEVVALDHVVITYWLDEAVREVRVVQIEAIA
jgi:hypothetical protein